jgi:Acyl-CoA carboxylase epsilon subunit
VSERPTLRLVSGSPTAEELAVLTAVVTAVAAGADETPDEERNRRGRWSDPAAMHRRPLLQGPNGWRAAAWHG